MTDKKFTDEEIIKALEWCPQSMGWIDCIKCPCYDEKRTNTAQQCQEKVMKNALDLMNRQKAEIEKLNIQLRELWKMASLYKAESERWEDYNKNLLTANTALSNEILEAKAEAYKEFAERLKNMCKEIITQEWNKKAAPVSWSHAYADFIGDIDNLLKEMVGEEE